MSIDKYFFRRLAVAVWVGLTTWILVDFVRYVNESS